MFFFFVFFFGSSTPLNAQTSTSACRGRSGEERWHGPSSFLVIFVLRWDQSSSMGLLSSWASSAMSSSSPEPIRLFNRFPAGRSKYRFFF